MASNITYTTIDEEYPVAGQDNDSQGFRDNFNIIKENFRNAILEIESLQGNRARLDVTNEFDNNFEQKNVNLAQSVEKADTSAFTNGILSAANISLTAGHHHVIKAEGDITLTFTDWPNSGRYCEMRVQVYGDGVSDRAVTFVTENAGTLKTDGNGAWTGNVIQTGAVAANSKLIKAFSYDGGANVFLSYEAAFS
jgi:hypothetical protein